MARTDKVVLLTGDYAQRLDALYQQATAALNDESPKTLAEGDPYADLESSYKTLKAEAISAATVVEMTAIARPVWRELKRKYPPRTEGSKELIEGDRLGGVNTDEVEDDLVHASVTGVAEKGKPVALTSRGAFDEWANTLSEGEWQTVLTKAWELANGARFDPKSLPASRTRSTD